MPRCARIIIPNIPHHVTQRGNHQERVFFGRRDFATYISYVAEQLRRTETEVWAYCLMPNHVHFVMVPRTKTGLSDVFRVAHRRYTCHINKRREWTGHLFQRRFYSTAMDEFHLYNAARYVELNPVRALLCRRAVDWPWSSARAHVDKEDDELVRVRPMLDRVDDWATYLSEPSTGFTVDDLRKATISGKPIGSDVFIKDLEARTGLSLKSRPPGRPRK